MRDRPGERRCGRCGTALHVTDSTRVTAAGVREHMDCDHAARHKAEREHVVQPPRSPRELQIARDEWRRLGRKVVREVERHAKHGQRHPNLRVATVAYRWAAGITPPDETRADARRAYGRAIGLDAAVGLLLAMITGGGGATGAATGVTAGQRRRARRIVELGPPPTL